MIDIATGDKVKLVQDILRLVTLGKQNREQTILNIKRQHIMLLLTEANGKRSAVTVSSN